MAAVSLVSRNLEPEMDSVLGDLVSSAKDLQKCVQRHLYRGCDVFRNSAFKLIQSIQQVNSHLNTSSFKVDALIDRFFVLKVLSSEVVHLTPKRYQDLASSAYFALCRVIGKVELSDQVYKKRELGFEKLGLILNQLKNQSCSQLASQILTPLALRVFSGLEIDTDQAALDEEEQALFFQKIEQTQITRHETILENLIQSALNFRNKETLVSLMRLAKACFQPSTHWLEFIERLRELEVIYQEWEAGFFGEDRYFKIFDSLYLEFCSTFEISKKPRLFPAKSFEEQRARFQQLRAGLGSGLEKEQLIEMIERAFCRADGVCDDKKENLSSSSDSETEYETFFNASDEESDSEGSEILEAIEPNGRQKWCIIL